MVERRRMLQKIETPEVFEGEIVNAPVKRGNDLEERESVQKHELNMKVLESLPDVIHIINDLVNIQKIKTESAAEIKRLDKEIDKIRAQTDDFVRRKIEERQTMQSKGEKAQSMLRELYAGLSQMNESDEIKSKVLDTFNLALKAALEEK